MPVSASIAPSSATAPLLDPTPSDVRVLLDLEVVEHVVYGFSCALDLPADEADRLINAAQDERSAWANEHEDEWIDELPIGGFGGVLEITERTAVCHGIRTPAADIVTVRQDQAHLAAAVALVAAQFDDDAMEQFEALALDAGLLRRCECGWNLDLNEVRCGQCRRPAPAS